MFIGFTIAFDFPILSTLLKKVRKFKRRASVFLCCPGTSVKTSLSIAVREGVPLQRVRIAVEVAVESRCFRLSLRTERSVKARFLSGRRQHPQNTPRCHRTPLRYAINRDGNSTQVRRANFEARGDPRVTFYDDSSERGSFWSCRTFRSLVNIKLTPIKFSLTMVKIRFTR